MKFAPLLLAGLIGAWAPPWNSTAEGAARHRAAAASPAASTRSTPLPPGAPRLAFPLNCTVGESCALQNLVDRDPGPLAKDYRCGLHTYHAHSGIDIRLLDMAAQKAGIDVLAASAGRVSRLRDGVADVSVKAAGAGSVAGSECGNGVVINHGGGWETQYCHMARGSIRVKLGDSVVSGQPIGRVGLSGNTEYPHLHLTIRRGTETIDPFAPSPAQAACDPEAASTAGLWDPTAAQALRYQRGVVLNAGFSATAVPMEVVEVGGILAPTARSPALIAFVRAINLEGGDVQELVIVRPDGSILARSVIQPLDRAKAHYVMYTGKRAPAEGWARGTYTATYLVRRQNQVVVRRIFDIRL